MSKLNRKQGTLLKALPLAMIAAFTLTVGFFSVKKIIKYFSHLNDDEVDQDDAAVAPAPSETSSESSWESLLEIDRDEEYEILSEADEFELLQ